MDEIKLSFTAGVIAGAVIVIILKSIGDKITEILDVKYKAELDKDLQKINKDIELEKLKLNKAIELRREENTQSIIKFHARACDNCVFKRDGLSLK